MRKEQALQYLNALERFGIKLGLERIKKVLSLLGNPQQHFKVIHIAGTNGKGSVAAFIASILQEAGFAVGLYTSPHLLAVNERIQVDGRKIADAELTSLIDELKELNEKHNFQLTHFEFLTAAAFLYFARKKVNFAVVEVGLGGRLDATNVVKPEIAIITNVGLEHQEYLGDNLLKIAREKAGIIKENSTVISAEQNESILNLFKQISSRKKSEFVPLKEKIHYEKILSDLEKQEFNLKIPEKEFLHLRVSLLGNFQKLNAATALEAVEKLKEKEHLKISEKAIRLGLAKTKWPGRFEIARKKPIIILDSGHNPAAVHALVEALDEFFPGKKITFVFGCSSDKDVAGMIEMLAGKAKFFYITKARYRGTDVKKIEKEVKKQGIDYKIIAAVAKAAKTAIKNAEESDVICICGSNFVVAEAKRHL